MELLESTPPSRARKTVTHAETLPAFTVEAGETNAAGVKFIQIRSRATGEALLSVADSRAVDLARAILRAHAHNRPAEPATATPVADMVEALLRNHRHEPVER